MQHFLNELKKFLHREKTLSFIIALLAAYGIVHIITSFITHIFSPLIGQIWGIRLDELTFTLGNVAVQYGKFLSDILFTLLLGFVLYQCVTGSNKLARQRKAKAKMASPPTKICPYCQSVINIDAERCPYCTSHFL